MIFVTSWDDGHPLDERVAELLGKYGVHGTFYVPIRNREGRPVMAPDALRRLAGAGFEIGGHTLDHVYLTTCSPAVVDEQIGEGKVRLEQILDHQVDGFCYPGGKMSPAIREAVRRAGFKYGRTIENFRTELGMDPYRVPTGLQFFPHSRRVLWSNFARYGHYQERVRMFSRALAARHWWERLTRSAEALDDGDAVIHLWGHSWEIEEYGLWSELETTLGRLAGLASENMSVGDLLARAKAASA
jgi:peptidoglycan/xylan/chitin deacetylase (PgdA/CDA1 family)